MAAATSGRKRERNTKTNLKVMVHNHGVYCGIVVRTYFDSHSLLGMCVPIWSQDYLFLLAVLTDLFVTQISPSYVKYRTLSLPAYIIPNLFFADIAIG